MWQDVHYTTSSVCSSTIPLHGCCVACCCCSGWSARCLCLHRRLRCRNHAGHHQCPDPMCLTKENMCLYITPLNIKCIRSPISFHLCLGNAPADKTELSSQLVSMGVSMLVSHKNQLLGAEEVSQMSIQIKNIRPGLAQIVSL